MHLIRCLLRGGLQKNSPLLPIRVIDGFPKHPALFPMRESMGAIMPEDGWEGFEEAEDGRGIEMLDEHFTNPPA